MTALAKTIAEPVFGQIDTVQNARQLLLRGKHAEHETLHRIGFYNEERLHEELGDLPPAEYEELNYKKDNIKTLST